ncbi:FGGY-family carbohydrate kinase [Chelativorans sp. YIM 93263]|uniref:FGGY-family carbohydrate kinase n=1 Tax=Chelativorans sp. YIM 93263 TaxID=2906648 RepID=UPI0023795155|nr:FGGY-family carbohydrate kinase [Chelativorans sp. YIM 93263]
MRDLVCAVDVGTGSARAAIVDRTGKLLSREEHPIVMNRPGANHAEHDSEDIWRAVCRAVEAAREAADASAERIAAIAFDATCSLVVRGGDGKQLSVSTTGDSRWDTIVWLDHRALAEADECTATGNRVLDYLGGVMSPEMQTPKLMWLKRHKPETWASAAHFFDLADFLTWKATGSTARSQCTLTAKWTYLAHENGWQQDFFESLGISDMIERGGLPRRATPVGDTVGHLTPQAATALGLDAECVVGTGVIDAFAGALGTIGGFEEQDVEHHVALIAGTSSCLMGMAPKMRQVSGVWGPYFGAAIPSFWLWEGGQSATGALLDHIIRMFGGGREPDAATHRAIVQRIDTLRQAEGAAFASGIHVLPDFHGNRSPHADPHARGGIIGLSLDYSFDTLCRVYWRTAVAIAFGLRQILDHLAAHGYRVETLHVTGGHRRNPLLMELYTDATGRTVHEPQTEDAVLLGTAMVAAAAAGWFPSLSESCRAMRPSAGVRRPDPGRAESYDRDYRTFLKLQKEHRALA